MFLYLEKSSVVCCSVGSMPKSSASNFSSRGAMPSGPTAFSLYSYLARLDAQLKARRASILGSSGGAGAPTPSGLGALHLKHSCLLAKLFALHLQSR